MYPPRPGNKYVIRENNEALILDTLRVRRTVARSELVQLTGLSPAAITEITSKLIQTGLIAEVRTGPSTGGRPPKILALNPEGGYVVGAKLTPQKITAVTVNLVGEVVDQHTVKWRGSSPAQAEQAVVNVAETLRDRASGAIMGLGVTLPGLIDHNTGVVRHSGLFGWDDVPLGASLSERLEMPVEMDNLVDALSTGLVLFGEGRGIDHLLVVSIGNSVGSGLVLNGRIYRGASGTTGSITHTSVSVLTADETVCHCGARGCLETVASEWAMRTKLARIATIDLDTAAKRAGEDLQIQRIFADAGRALGGAVANVVKVVNPQRIILGGEGTRLGPLLLEPFRKELYLALLRTDRSDVDLHVVRTDELTWARGAACQLLTEVFQISSARPTAGSVREA